MASGTDRKLRGKAAFICQRVSPIKGGSASPEDASPARTDAKQFAEGARLLFANCVCFTPRKTPPSGGQARLRRSTEFLLSPKIANV
jgi:hypothetical protein